MALDNTFRATVVLANTNAKPEDACTNTFHFLVDSSIGDIVQANTIRDRLQAFYGDGTNSVSSLINNSISRTAGQCRVKVYNLQDPTPRAPVLDDTITLDAPVASTRLPQEIACCLTYQADVASGEPQRRKRGRLYIGPLPANSIDTTTGLLTASHTLAFRTAASALAIENDSSTSWCVYSRVAGTSAVVTNGWTDDAPDIQRRRGFAPTVRNTWT